MTPRAPGQQDVRVWPAMVTVAQAGVLAPVGPFRLVRMAIAARRYSISPVTPVAVAAARWPDHPAIIDERGEISYSQLVRRVEALAAGLVTEFGVGPGSG